MFQPPLEPSAELPQLSGAITDEVQSHLATLWGTLRLIHQGRLDLHSPKGRQLLEAGIQNALHLLSLLRGPSLPEGVSCPVVLSQGLDSDIKLALGHGQLLLQYQPFFRLDSGELVGFEALLCWQHPERGWIPPSEFIPVAECSDLIHELGHWVLKTACQQMVRWQKQLGRPLQLSVNLSARQLD
ncbi:EAL domain-containing protein [Synechococcus bigranulatus str. 'Rupite']|uniref:EAL domain-containing protein n=1 Tax=Thermostichus vulcanus str. 'Rupite' TaxID=2813851 RepID=A0ABT0C6K4_THEVL|nr:EAL domain-containing protein [Thermostichus vulcanus str. 'Rupite']